MAYVITAEAFLKIASQGYLWPIEQHCKQKPGWVNEPIHQDGKLPLHLAASSRQLVLVKLLLSYGANISSTDQAGNTPLHTAAKHNAGGIVKYLIDHGANKDAVNKARQSPLHVAVENNSLGATSELIECGANVQAEGKDRVTPLHAAAQAGHFEVAAALLLGGANANAQEKVGWSPLHLAVDNQHEDVVQLLLSYHASPNVISKWGWTPLHLAAQLGSSRMVKLLLAAGADHTLTTKDRKTAYHIAVQQEQALVLPLLLGARQDTSSDLLSNYSVFASPSATPRSSVFNNSLLMSQSQERQSYQAFPYGTASSTNSPSRSLANSMAESPGSSKWALNSIPPAPRATGPCCPFCFGTSEYNPPAAFICPLSQQLMSDPVFTSDGYTFDRNSIEEWFERNPNKSPLTGLQLADPRLTPNILLRCTIKDWKKFAADRKAAVANGQ